MPISTTGAVWELQRNDRQTMAYTRMDKATGLQICRVESEIMASLNTLIAIQRDADNFYKWMDGVKASTIVDQGDRFYISHTRVPSPWPVRDRDSVVRSDIQQQPDGVVLIDFASVEGVVPARKNYERVQDVKGGWRFTPLGYGKTRLEYELMVDPGGKLPTWLVNRFALDVPYNTVKAMHKLVSDKRYTKARSWIREIDALYQDTVPSH